MIIDRYQYFLFDIDRTLWDFNANAAVAMEQVLDAHAAELKALPFEKRSAFMELYEENNHRLWREYEAGLITKDFLRRERFRKSLSDFCGIDDEALADRIGHDYLEFMALGKLLIPGTLDVLEAIRLRGGKMAIVSNGFKEVQYRKMSVSGISDYFDAVAISEEVGVHKPHPEIFMKALEGLGGDASSKTRTLMVGDDLLNDIRGARDFGIDQFYYNPHFNPSSKASVSSDTATYESNSLLALIA